MPTSTELTSRYQELYINLREHVASQVIEDYLGSKVKPNYYDKIDDILKWCNVSPDILEPFREANISIPEIRISIYLSEIDLAEEEINNLLRVALLDQLVKRHEKSTSQEFLTSQKNTIKNLYEKFEKDNRSKIIFDSSIGCTLFFQNLGIAFCILFFTTIMLHAGPAHDRTPPSQSDRIFYHGIIGFGLYLLLMRKPRKIITPSEIVDFARSLRRFISDSSSTPQFHR